MSSVRLSCETAHSSSSCSSRRKGIRMVTERVLGRGMSVIHLSCALSVVYKPPAERRPGPRRTRNCRPINELEPHRQVHGVCERSEWGLGTSRPRLERGLPFRPLAVQGEGGEPRSSFPRPRESGGTPRVPQRLNRLWKGDSRRFPLLGKGTSRVSGWKGAEPLSAIAVRVFPQACL